MPVAGSHPRYGAVAAAGGVRFRVFAPPAGRLRLEVLTGAGAGTHEPGAVRDGIAEFFVAGAQAGDLYQYTIDGSPPRPDPATRFQPAGVHGPSEVVDPSAFRWQHERWRPVPPRELVIYELHVGTFTREGTFASAQQRLPELRDLGISAIELMPVGEFAGTRNWGYDGVCPFAPSRNYGRPDDLRAFVDAAHHAGLAVLLDVVYNHLGPEGAYVTLFHPRYFSDRHPTPWGSAINLDGPGSALVRSFIVDNALHWVREYRLDGLRLDATHALVDTSSPHLVAEIAGALRSAIPWPLMIHAEDHRNLASMVDPTAAGGWGLDAVWADDFHHVLRRHLAGDAHGYYADYEGTCAELAATIREGWLYIGQPSRRTGLPRGTNPSNVPMRKCIVCLQNHDQVGNRATGDRLHHQIDGAAWRAASTILLMAPMTPLLFMGQEWACSSPFQYFTDLEPGLGTLVTEGRRLEFRHFPAFADPEARHLIPDPQDRSTFERSVLDWSERERAPHREVLELYTALLHLRRAHPALGADEHVAGEAEVLDAHTLLVRRKSAGEEFVIVARLSGAGRAIAGVGGGVRTLVLTTEDERFSPDPHPIDIDGTGDTVAFGFHRPGAVVLRVQ